MGKAKGKGSACLDYKKEGRNYCSGKNKAFTVDESSMGSEEKSKRKEVNSAQQVFSQPGRLVKCVAAYCQQNCQQTALEKLARVVEEFA